MFGKNQIEKQNLGDGKTLRIVAGSPWFTIQGEGPYAGHPAIFIRLHGCMLRCHFCDTNFDNPKDPIVDINWLLNEIKKLPINVPPQLCVITGGEPTNQNITLLINNLHKAGYKVQIETAGVNWIDNLDQIAEIICSPKTPTIHPKVLSTAKAFKYVISAAQQFDRFIPIMGTQPGVRAVALAAPRLHAPVYLSPMDEYDEIKNAANRKLVGKLAMRYGCIAAIQLHKFLEQD